MRVLFGLTGLGLARGQLANLGREIYDPDTSVNPKTDTFAAATTTYETNKAGLGTSYAVGSYPNNQAGAPNVYVTGADAAADRAAERAGRSTTAGGFQAALNSLVELLTTQRNNNQGSLDQIEQTWDKDKCNYEKAIKKNEAKAEDEQKRLDTAKVQEAKWDREKNTNKGKEEAEMASLQASHIPIVNACDDWTKFVCTAPDSLLNQLHQAVDDAALLYAALSKLAEKRADFGFGVNLEPVTTLGLLQMTPEQTEQIKISDEDVTSLQNIQGLSSLIQAKVSGKLQEPYGSGGGGVVGALKGIYDNVVSNAQALVLNLNQHGIEGDADYLDESVTVANCVSRGLGGCSSTGTDCAACPTATTAWDSAVWDRISPSGQDTLSQLMKTQLAQRKAHESKYLFLETSRRDAENEYNMWVSKRNDAETKLKNANSVIASKTEEKQQATMTYDKEVKEHQDLITGINKALEILTDPSIIKTMTDDAATFIQVDAPPSLIQTEVLKSAVATKQQATLAGQNLTFNSVISSIQKMIANLQVQIQDEDDRKAKCTNDKADANDERVRIEDDVSTLNSNLQLLQNDIATYEGDIANWESHAKDIEDQFNDDMDTCQRDLADAQKQKDDASTNERMFSRINGVLSNLRLDATTRNTLLCDTSNAGHQSGWGCTTNGYVVILMKEARTIQDDESERMEKTHLWCNQQRDIYSINIRNAKTNIAEQNVYLATAREEARKTDSMLLHANEAFSSAEAHEDAVERLCDGLISGVQARKGEWQKEIAALTSIKELLATSV